MPYRVKSVISIMIMHICLASIMISLPKTQTLSPGSIINGTEHLPFYHRCYFMPLLSHYAVSEGPIPVVRMLFSLR